MSHSSSSVTADDLEKVSERLEQDFRNGLADSHTIQHPAHGYDEKTKHHHQLELTGDTTADFPVPEPTGETDSPLTLTPQGTHDANFLVAFHPGDPDDPKNWPPLLKWTVTFTVSILCFVVAFASSVVTSGVFPTMAEFRVSEVVALLTVSLFVIGFGVGMFRLFISTITISRRILTWDV
jgi:hypothetical protein